MQFDSSTKKVYEGVLICEYLTADILSSQQNLTISHMSHLDDTKAGMTTIVMCKLHGIAPQMCASTSLQISIQQRNPTKHVRKNSCQALQSHVHFS